MRGNFEQITTLQYRCRSLSKQVDDFKSGEKYRQMEEAYKKLLRFHNKEMKRMKYELSKAHSEAVTVRKYWSEVMDDLEKEYQKEVRRLLTEIEHLKKIKTGICPFIYVVSGMVVAKFICSCICCIYSVPKRIKIPNNPSFRMSSIIQSRKKTGIMIFRNLCAGLLL